MVSSRVLLQMKNFADCRRLAPTPRFAGALGSVFGWQDLQGDLPVSQGGGQGLAG